MGDRGTRCGRSAVRAEHDRRSHGAASHQRDGGGERRQTGAARPVRGMAHPHVSASSTTNRSVGPVSSRRSPAKSGKAVSRRSATMRSTP